MGIIDELGLRRPALTERRRATGTSTTDGRHWGRRRRLRDPLCGLVRRRRCPIRLDEENGGRRRHGTSLRELGSPRPRALSKQGRTLTSPPSRTDAIAALNQVLSEVVDFVQEVKQAHRRVPENHHLHGQLDRLFDDLRSWARLLVEEDEQLGVSPLASMPSVAGRTPPNLWPRAATDEEVRRAVVDHLDRLADHLTVALAKQYEAGSQTVLADIHQGVMSHIQALSDP